MSVLYKALQKAQKENQDRSDAPAPAFDAERLAGSGAIRVAGRGGVNWRAVGGIVSLVLAAVIVIGFFLIDTSPPPVPARPPPQAAAPALQPPPAPPAATSTETPVPPPAETVAGAVPAPDSAPAPQVVADAVPEPVAQAAPAADTAAAPAPAQLAAAQPAPAPGAPVEPAQAETAQEAAPAATAVSSAPPPAPPPVPETASSPAVTPMPEPMPQIAADSPARALQPPINIRRAEYDFSGVGNAVQVRQVSQQAQDNVGAGYNALVRGDFDMALGFYDRALQQEPSSVMAQLGRAAALHKLGRLDEARAAYDRVLKADPKNREALTNLTAILAERAPAEAIPRLIELERDYPQFSPLKAQIGLTYAKMGALDQALDYLRQAVNLTPDAVLYRYNLALVLDRMGRREQAVAAYDQLLDTAAGGRLPPGIDVAQIENRVRFLRVK